MESIVFNKEIIVIIWKLKTVPVILYTGNIIMETPVHLSLFFIHSTCGKDLARGSRVLSASMPDRCLSAVRAE